MQNDNLDNKIENLHKITKQDFIEFTNANNYDEQLRILIEHSKKNQKRILIKRKNKMENQKKIEQEMLELNNQFSEFLHTKGIVAKFKLAFNNMAESAKQQHKNDVKNFNEIKAKSAEENKDFVEFLHAKGIKAKFHVVVENIKRGIKEAPQKTASDIAKVKANVNANPYVNKKVSADDLAKQFNEFLKQKGLENEYTVEIVEE